VARAIAITNVIIKLFTSRLLPEPVLLLLKEAAK
jgi:hypothetical protein